MGMRGGGVAVLVVAVGVLPVAGCTDPAGAGTDDGDVVTVGVAGEEPYGYLADGEATGFSADVARAVLDDLGRDVEFEEVDFGELIGGLQSGRFDVVAAGMYITPERMQQIAFSDPDYCTTESLAVAKGNPEQIFDYASIRADPELTIAVADGTVEADYAADAGIPAGQIRRYPGIEQLYDALAAGEVDAVTGTAATVRAGVNDRDAIEAVDDFFPKDDDGNETLPCGGYGFRLDDTDFRNAFNKKLNALRADGTTTRLITAYEDADGNPYFTEDDVELANNLTVADFEVN